jgi:hypothetical protein
MERTPGIHCTGDWVGMEAKRKGLKWSIPEGMPPNFVFEGNILTCCMSYLDVTLSHSVLSKIKIAVNMKYNHASNIQYHVNPTNN